MQKDNSTLSKKVNLRRRLLNLIPDPIVMETHGGLGKVWQSCYSHIDQGMVFEKNDAKINVLAKQRPQWIVYQSDALSAIEAGFGRMLPVNFIDIDPYGAAWPFIGAFLDSAGAKPDVLAFAINDGLRQKLRLTGGWDVAIAQDAVMKYGNKLAGVFLEASRDFIEKKAAKAGYGLDRFWGYYCGEHDPLCRDPVSQWRIELTGPLLPEPAGAVLVDQGRSPFGEQMA